MITDLGISTILVLLSKGQVSQSSQVAGQAVSLIVNSQYSREDETEADMVACIYMEISIKDYLPPLINEIIDIFPNKNMVTIETEMADFPLSERVVSPLGIIVNEFTTNAMKYAFTGRDRGLITVSASLNNNRVTLVFEDNGNSIPESIDIEKSTRFRLQLVALLTKQLRGTLRLERQKGTKFILEFEV